MNCQAYVLRQGYPPVQPGRSNPALARRLFAAYAGQISEMSAVAQYFYNSLLSALDAGNELSEAFSCISHTEMHHLDLLGQMILAYGGDPGLLSYRGDRKIWWSGDFVHHVKQPARMLAEAIEGEQAAISNYESLLPLIPDPGNQAVIERILADEQHHVVLFENLLAQIPMPLRGE